MMTNLFDHEMLARQRSEALERAAAQRHTEGRPIRHQPSGPLTRLRAFRLRFGATEPQAVASRPA